MTDTSININRIPIHGAAAGDELDVPNLDFKARRKPVEFLFTMTDGHGIIARSNLHALRGAPKTGKSAWGLILMAAALKGEFLGIKAQRKDITILWIDTEQDESVMCEKGLAVLDMAGLDEQPGNLIAVNLRGYIPADRLAVTRKKINDYAPDFVFLDGVADLCPDFNDQVAAQEITQQLGVLSEQYGAAILCLIHTNKRDDEAKGHLGSFIQQKSAEIYQVNKQAGTNIAVVKQALSRFAPAPEFAFSFADDFRLTTAEDAQQRANDEAREKARSTFAQFFKDDKRLTNGDLVEAYVSALGGSDRTASREIKKAVNWQVLHRSKEGRNAYYSYIFPDLPNLAEDDEDL